MTAMVALGAWREWWTVLIGVLAGVISQQRDLVRRVTIRDAWEARGTAPAA